ncbi:MULTISPECIES: hypothetical protein [Kitasatospora]|uniref:Uncharacterized protein n=1 Tax=Kitasatospora setae (strain ATCC 33774 / DSM 43861 / JCM 3304 / KCC A-0304 / NBRC 14216 / KM-6054) TaxID=452652 RepID=E4NG61_KITSK|nr:MULTISPECIES: hypothetical protein [Kitasatospora]BAJ30491.1 hypothetical protein KSE_47110 [Kitasatospora setae KM-6054]
MTEAGIHWDAVAVQQEPGLAALSVLDQETGHRTGPVIWDTRNSTLYFLVPAASAAAAADPALGTRPLSRGTYIGVPGVDRVDPTGLCWIAPPSPTDLDQLVDPLRLAAVLRHLATARWVTRAVAGGREVDILASDEQLAGRACIVCRTTRRPLHPDGVVTLQAGAGVVRDYDTVVCTRDLEAGHGQ